ncbi:unnamed protein product [Angiostrongylus costaricensis]|uniref:Uncharacterized protein n=1 Tax=Angiostrongylus costaricensis TaxID=334426 RepID=A0A0R3P9Z0_ANGCS|nr:unnamed protein product [Angiostrongylus costaricensis]
MQLFPFYNRRRFRERTPKCLSFSLATSVLLDYNRCVVTGEPLIAAAVVANNSRPAPGNVSSQVNTSTTLLLPAGNHPRSPIDSAELTLDREVPAPYFMRQPSSSGSPQYVNIHKHLATLTTRFRSIDDTSYNGISL